MAAVSAYYVSSLYNADAFARGAGKRASSSEGAPPAKVATKVQDRLSDALEAMKRAPEEHKQAARNRARDRVEAVREQLKIIKELYAQNPKEMAKALRHLVKELQTALKAYKEAGGDMTSIGGAGLIAMTASAAPSRSTGAPGSEPDANAAETGAETDDAPVFGESAASPAHSPGEGPRPDSSDMSVEELEARLGVLRGDEGVVRSVDGLRRKIKELCENSKLQSAFLSRDRSRDEAFEALDEDLEALDEDVTAYKRDVQDELIAVRLEIKLIERGELSAPVALDVSA